ncbi:MAG: pantetheine-phosphate adenylyltransferase [Oscillospiraceae bacterium]|nr:pantetheine-phosphate adenylyltransferase [Oscillospiraceae bacterium]
MAIYIYPGSFDPVTNGHLDIIKRASGMCSKLIVAIGHNRQKRVLFTLEERIDLLSESVKEFNVDQSIEIFGFEGLLAHHARLKGASVIVKGLRAMSDFEYEVQMALLNKHIDNDLETIFLIADTRYTYLSSSAVKELAANNGNLNGLVPEYVITKLREKFARGSLCDA